MRYSDFEEIMTSARMSRYLNACGSNSRKAMTLYRKNLQLTQEMFTLISCFEVALRNAIDRECKAHLGADWLRDSIRTGGVFDHSDFRLTEKAIREAVNGLNPYSHNKVVAELGFGFWRFLFAQKQYRATGQILLRIFPSKPTSTPTLTYNHTYIFNELAKLNKMRNRMAHHEPICFQTGRQIIDTSYARQQYILVLQLFQWMRINEASLLYGLDHINRVCDEIDNL